MQNNIYFQLNVWRDLDISFFQKNIIMKLNNQSMHNKIGLLDFMIDGGMSNSSKF